MSSEIVSIIFRLLNFGVVCAIAAYFFKVKLLPSTKKKIAAKHAELQNMSKENQSLLDRQQALEQEIERQKQSGRKLYDKVKHWFISFEQQQKELKKERDSLAHEASRRLQEQAERKLQNHVKVLVLEKALQGVQKKLQNYFSSEQAGKKFIASLVDRMREDRV